jgi:FkbM family methyltransferase
MPRGILDVGANCGDWACMALSVFPSARVLMIEPLREMEGALQRICSDSPACEYFLVAAGREDGELTMTVFGDLAGSSFVKMASREPRLTKVSKIDNLLGQSSGFQPDLVKLDVQGFELEALAGGTTLFGQTELFMIETSLFSFGGQPITREVIAFMADRGYELYDITDHIRRPYDGALGQVDLAFAKRDGQLRACSRWGR